MAYDALSLSVCLNKATLKNAKYSKKVVKRVKDEQYKIKFSQLGNLKDLHLQVFADASLGNIELNSETKSVMGSFICLSNNKNVISPLTWKSKVIDKVATDIKSAETLALESAIEDAIHLTSMISEVYTGNITSSKIPIIVNEDSKGLVDSLYSKRKVRTKSMRILLSCIQQYIKTGVIKEINHVSSKNQLGDIFTKRGVLNQNIIHAVSQGTLHFPKPAFAEWEKSSISYAHSHK